MKKIILIKFANHNCLKPTFKVFVLMIPITI